MCLPALGVINPELTRRSWVQDLLKDSKRFDYQSIVGDDESKKSRLCFWNEDTAGDQAYRFDIILGVSFCLNGKR